jgi:hypothetical protein
MDAVHAEKATTIFVNTREKHVAGKEISFEQVVRLAYDPVPTGPMIEITVTYRKGEHGKQGTLTAGGTVKLHEDMAFNVVVTDKS